MNKNLTMMALSDQMKGYAKLEFPCSNLTIETLEQSVKYVRS